MTESRTPKADGQAAMVTGAGGSVGRAVCVALARVGFVVLAADLTSAACARAVDLVVPEGGMALPVVLDVRDPGSWQEALDFCERATGSNIGVLVNNAGINAAQAGALDIDAWHQLVAVNLTGTFLGCASVLPGMTRRRSGVIVNISSIGAMAGAEAGHLGYFASKGGVRALSKAVAAQFGPHGIRCVSVHPGWLPPMGGGGSRPAEICDAIPLRRLGEPEDVASVVEFLVSERAAYVTGTEVIVDGGVLGSYQIHPPATAAK